jgi:hypothetical protein
LPFGEQKAKMILKGADMTSNEFFRGLLAALAATGQKDLPANHAEIHRAFYQVLRVVQSPETRKQLDIEDLIDIDYDPLYGQSGWFDRALTRAQRDHIISFPNPSYDTISIKYDPDSSREVLQRLRSRPTIERLAQIFLNELKPKQEATT